MRGHAGRVSALAVAVARRLGWDRQTTADVHAAALLHDVGKLSLAAELLAKPGPLTPQERREVQLHPAAGARLLGAVPQARRLLPYVLYHHERWDGRGYPTRVPAASTPVEARLVALADAYDAMTSDRPYRDALTDEEALGELARCAGTQFDPMLAATCVEVWAEAAATAPPTRRASYVLDGSPRR